jgi:hypothetical protein
VIVPRPNSTVVIVAGEDAEQVIAGLCRLRLIFQAVTCFPAGRVRRNSPMTKAVTRHSATSAVIAPVSPRTVPAASPASGAKS